MRTEMKIDRLRPLVIGHEMDNLTGLVEIDCAAWMTAYPELTRYTLAVAPPEGEPYFTPAGMEGAILRWIVRREDTAMAGEGSYQIIGTGENGEQKSTDFYPLYIYRNMPGLDGADKTPPEAALAWVNKVLAAANRAENAAERAEGAAAGSVPVAKPDSVGVVKPGEGLEVEKDGTLNVIGGSGGQPGKDGGYYVPNVSEEGSLTWQASKEDMPAVPPANIKGPKGDPGEPGGKGEPGEPGSPGAAGKTAYEYAKEGGYNGTEADFVAKLAKEIPDAYTLPTASETVKGGVKVGTGLRMDGDVLNAEVAKKDVDELSKEIDDLKTGGESSDSIPDYWEEHLNEKIARIKELQRNGGKDCYSFVSLADFHHSDKRNNYSPVLIKKIMDECGIKFCLCLGDIQSGGSWATKEQELADWEGVDEAFRPIQDRVLMIPGNHDGAYGTADMNGDGVISGTTDYYIYNLTPDEVYDLVCRKVSLINGVKFDKEKFGYYVDEPNSKVRYILINTHYSDGATNEDDTAVNNYMRRIRVGQSQLDMVIEALNGVPDTGWHIVVGMHIPLASFTDSNPSGDMVLLRDLLEAYNNKRSYSNTFGTVGMYDYSSVSADFAHAKGDVIGVFCGHLHSDVYNRDYGFPIIVSASDNTASIKVDGNVVSGEVGTITEQSFDIMTVDRRAGIIYATKVGFGEDRMFGIDEAYNVSLNVEGAKASNIATVVVKYAPYRNVITPHQGRVFDSISVTMGGIDVTADVYADGVINIESVTGDVAIMVATTYAFTNLVDRTSEDYRSEEGHLYKGVFNESGSAYYNKNLFVTNFIPITKNDILRIKGVVRDEYTHDTPARIEWYDENKEYVTATMLHTENTGKSSGFIAETSEAFTATGILTYEVMIRGDNGQQFVYNDFCNRVKYIRVSAHWLTTEEDVIITVNEEIV